MTRFLVDQNVYPSIVELLRLHGFDVKDAREAELASSDDAALAALARAEGRTLVSFDQHFANPLLYPDDSHAGIVRIRIHPPTLREVQEAFERFLHQFDLDTLAGALVSLDRDGYRVRRLRER